MSSTRSDRQITIRASGIEISARLNASETAEAVWRALPIQAEASTWGDEIYCSIPVAMETERGQETVAVGDLAYWSPGRALCVFFGPTPASAPGEIRPASAVTVIGQVLGDPTPLRQVAAGTSLAIERENPNDGPIGP